MALRSTALRKIGKALLYGCLGILGLLVLCMFGLKLALDRAPRYQAQIKEWVHGQIGYHIAFKHVSPAFRWYGPELYFDEFELRSKDDARLLAHAAGGRIGIDIRQLLRSGKLLAGRIEVDAPVLDVTRLGPESFALASEIQLGAGDPSESALLSLDDLPSGTLAIRRGVIAVHDWNAALPLLELRDVSLDLRHRDGVAVLAVAARLPRALGGELHFNGSVRGSGAVDTLVWSAAVRTNNLDLSGWRRLLPQYLGALAAGQGGFEVTASGRGRSIARADLECAATAIATQLADENVVRFDKVSGGFTLTHAGESWAVLGRRVRTVRDGHRDPDSEFEIHWRESDQGLLELRAKASYLRAETLLPLAGLLPQKDIRERVQEVGPTGEWLDTHVELSRSSTAAPWKLSVGARFRGVGFAAVGHAPGMRGLDGTLSGTDAGGRLDLDARAAVFSWPSQLEQPLELQEFKTTLYWRRTADEFLVATPSLALRTHDAAAKAQVAWHRPAAGDSPVLTLVATVDDGIVAQTRRYLPRALLHANVLAWLDHAFVAGRMPHADVVFDGPVRHFPFRDGSGTFLARARLEGLTLNYRDDWPRGENLQLLAEFRNEGLTVSLAGGTLSGLALRNGGARFVDFKDAELQAHFSLAGDAVDALRFLRDSPLDAQADHAFSSVQAAGPLQADVLLFMPFKEFARHRSVVRAHLQGVTVNRGAPLSAGELFGDAEIDGANVARADVHGRLLGGAFQMQARAPHARPLSRTLLTFTGSASGAEIAAALALPAAATLSGTTDWHAVLRMSSDAARERALHVDGSLAGLELGLPEPLAKPAGRALPASLDVQWLPGGGTQVHVNLGSVLRGQAVFEPGTGGPTVKRAALSFGPGAAPLVYSDTQMFNISGNIERLDLAGWLRLYSPDKGSKQIANLLRTAKIQVARIDYLGLSFLDLTLDLAAADGAWRIGVGGPNVTGSITLPAAADAAEPWKLEFKRLDFISQPGDPDEPGAPAEAATDARPDAKPGAVSGWNPRRIPAVDFHSAETRWDERELGDVRASLVKVEDGIRLEHCSATAATSALVMDGEWRGKDAGTGRIVGTLTSTDVGSTLKQLGYAAVLEAKSGKMDFDLSWLGAPTAAALGLATGHVQFALDKGQLTGVKPGAGRVVGLASVAALPRRLALDFSDLTDKGLAFDTARGNFDLRGGSAYTDDVLVKGPAAEIGLIGRVGLKSKDYDQTAVVTGNVGNTLPLAAFAGGPVIGAAVLVFTQVFKQPLKGLARGYYRITGSWDNPTVERIKSADAAAAPAEAPK